MHVAAQGYPLARGRPAGHLAPLLAHAHRVQLQDERRTFAIPVRLAGNTVTLSVACCYIDPLFDYLSRPSQ